MVDEPRSAKHWSATCETAGVHGEGDAFCPVSCCLFSRRNAHIRQFPGKKHRARALSQYKFGLSKYAIPMLEIRRSGDRLIFAMGIPIPVRRHLYIETLPGLCITTVTWRCHNNFSQWERSFHWKLRCHWLKGLRQRQIAVGPGVSISQTVYELIIRILYKYILLICYKWLIGLARYLSHATKPQLSWHVQNCDFITSLEK